MFKIFPNFFSMKSKRNLSRSCIFVVIFFIKNENMYQINIHLMSVFRDSINNNSLFYVFNNKVNKKYL